MNQKILIVDDDELIQQLVTLQLQSEGYQTTSVSTGGAMFAALADQQFDLIILDLGLPDGDGLSIAQHLRTKSTIPIIVVTARQGSDDRVMALGIGVNDYLVKPFDARELTLRISNILKPMAPAYVDRVQPVTPPPLVPPVYPAQGQGQYQSQPRPVEYATAPPQVSPRPRAERRGSGDERRDRRGDPKSREKFVKRRIKYLLLGTMAVAISVMVTTLFVAPDSPLQNQPAQTTEDNGYVPAPPAPANPALSQVKEKVVTVTLESPNSSAVPSTPSPTLVVPRNSAVDDSWIRRVSCEEFPQVSWWQIQSHTGVVRYVQQKHGGDFAEYYDTWVERLTKMQEILKRDSGAITRTKVVLRGEDLANYIQQLEKRLEIITCLSQAAIIVDPVNYKPVK